MKKQYLAALALASGFGLLTAVPTAAAQDSPPGPPLDVPVSELEHALSCNVPLAGITRDPVLLTPAFSTAEQSFGWNYLRNLPARGIPTCSITVPDHGYGDLQNAAEYVVYAVRKMSAQSGRKVAVVGHQHGPLDELWAIKFWPDIPGLVSTFVSLATPYHGTEEAATACGASHFCPPSVWQISTGSNFLKALDSRPLPAGPGYTSISTLFDELIVPQPYASDLPGGTHIVLQDICRLRPIEHFTILADNLSYLLVLDALAHPGLPADPAHISPWVCFGPLYQPGVLSPLELPRELIDAAGAITGAFTHVGPDGVHAEPALRSYAAAP
ncbi:MAG: hypothetical protein P4L83_03575 [Nevskia sp.]|nr:hypothetical protein [Nevskia sp.]